MSRKLIPVALLTTVILTSGAIAAPILSVIPQGLQGGNWVWEVDIKPDLALAGGSTPIAEEIGFRLTGDPLVSVTSLSPLIMDSNLAGEPIFGWETAYGSPAKPEGIEANCASCTVTNLATFGGHAATVVVGSTNEIFTAMGSVDYGLSTPIPFLRIVAQGPGTGGPSSSTIQWLGAYLGNGRIVQIVGNNVQAFDFSGTLTQSVPEPSAMVLASVAIGFLGTNRRFKRGRAA